MPPIEYHHFEIESNNSHTALTPIINKNPKFPPISHSENRTGFTPPS